MVSRLDEVTGGEYARLEFEPRNNQYSIMQGETGNLITTSNNLIHDINEDQKQMKKIVSTYSRGIANTKSEKEAVETFGGLETHSRQKVNELKMNIRILKDT